MKIEVTKYLLEVIDELFHKHVSTLRLEISLKSMDTHFGFKFKYLYKMNVDYFLNTFVKFIKHCTWKYYTVDPR